MLSNHNELFQSVDSEGYSKADAQRGCLKPFLNTAATPRTSHAPWHVARDTSYQHSTHN